jgi:hypothetical protein
VISEPREDSIMRTMPLTAAIAILTTLAIAMLAGCGETYCIPGDCHKKAIYVTASASGPVQFAPRYVEQRNYYAPGCVEEPTYGFLPYATMGGGRERRRGDLPQRDAMPGHGTPPQERVDGDPRGRLRLRGGAEPRLQDRGRGDRGRAVERNAPGEQRDPARPGEGGHGDHPQPGQVLHVALRLATSQSASGARGKKTTRSRAFF